MKVALFVTCLVDQLWSSVGTSTVEVLRRAGCEVEFADRQTCCAQQAFNTGYRDEARQVAQRFISIVEQREADGIERPAAPSPSMDRRCPERFAEDPEWLKRAQH